MKCNWCKWAVFAVTLAVAVAGFANLPPVKVPLARDLEEEARQAEGTCRPLVLEFSASYCEYCDLLEEEILKPILRNRDYDQRMLLRKLIVDSATTLQNFSGEPVTTEDLADHYDVVVTPTLLFVDREGKELTERMVGITTMDFYGGYLDQALQSAADRLRERGRCN